MIVQAKYALLAPGEVRRDVRLEVDGSRIVALRSGYVPLALRPDFDFGTAVITPGLVNTHSHLELEFCANQAPFDGSFPKWLQVIRDLKRARSNQGTPFPHQSLAALAACGCTTVLDHHTTELEWEKIDGTGLRYVAFREYFQFSNHEPDIVKMREQARMGFAPHSPYTTSVEIAQACRRLADERALPLSMHLSEMQAEVDFIRSGSGEELAALLSAAGAYNGMWEGSGMSPIRYFAEHGILTGPTYTVHANYLEPGDLDTLAGLQPTVVFCPHSHKFFRHPPHPLPQYLKAGIPVALGTDSLASNQKLSPLYEAELVRRSYPQVSASDVFAAITVRALGPLGWDRRLGRLEPGRLADFAVFPLPGDPGPEFDGLFDAAISSGEAALTVVNGRIIHSAVPQTAALP